MPEWASTVLMWKRAATFWGVPVLDIPAGHRDLIYISQVLDGVIAEAQAARPKQP